MTVDANQYGMPLSGATRNPFNYSKVEQIARDNTTAWLTAAEIRQQLNLFGDTSQDTYLASLELAIRQAIEDSIGMSIFPTSYRVWYGASSLTAAPLCFDLPEVSQNANPALDGVTITSLKYWDNSTPSAVVTVAAGQYYYDVSGNKVVAQNLPSGVNSSMTAPIYIDYVTAANPLAAYPVIKQAGLLLFTHIYNNRSNTTAANLKEIPFGVSTLLRPYRPLVM